MLKKKAFYITTPLYYPTGKLHLGHLYTTTIAWVLRNYKKAQGYNTLFLTGADEHGQKIAASALKEGLTPQSYVLKQRKVFQSLWKLFAIDYDLFAATDSGKHKQFVQGVFARLQAKKEVYLGKYKGFYSVPDEEFLTPTQAVRRNGTFYHPVSHHKLTLVEEPTFFLRVQKHVPWLLKQWCSHPGWVWPKHVVKELKQNFLKGGLKDLSITRTSNKWGVPVSTNPNHVVYVWFDALLGYLSSLTTLNEKFWNQGTEIVHVIGKEITRFHCLYWPMLLRLLSKRQPTRLQVHGWITTAVGKMSKSRGSIVDPVQLIKYCHPEVVKYFLIRRFPMGHDGMFVPSELVQVNNADLVNTYGNLINRTLVVFNKVFPRKTLLQPKKEGLTLKDKAIQQQIVNAFKKYVKQMDAFLVADAVATVMELGQRCNNYIDKAKPWSKNVSRETLSQVFNNLFNGIYALTAMLQVVIPEHAKVVAQILNTKRFKLCKVTDFKKFYNHNFGVNKVVFKRLEPNCFENLTNLI